MNLEEVDELSSIIDRDGSSPRSHSEQSESVPPPASHTSLQQGEDTVGMSSPRDASPRDGDQEHSSEIHTAEIQEDTPDSRNQTPQVIVENVEVGVGMTF